MAEWRMFHNPKCSTCRKTLALLREKGIEPEITEYLKDPLTPKALREVMAAVPAEPAQFVRTKEPEAKGLDVSDREAVLAALSDSPRLLQRPIVLRGDRGVIARPPERVEELL